MKVVVSEWAWLPKSALSPIQLRTLRTRLTIYPRKVGQHPGEPPGPVEMFQETTELLGIPRQYFLERRKPHHEVEFRFPEAVSVWKDPLKFSGSLRAEQADAVRKVTELLRGGSLGGILRAVPGWGKTVWACAQIATLRVPTLIVVHKEFLMNQWIERIGQFLPDARVGIVQQDRCDYQDKHVVVGMVHSLAAKDYGPVFRVWPGLVITDEVHRIGSRTWSQVPPRFSAKWRIGLSATPRRKDGADDVFLWHIGPLIYSAQERRMTPKVRRVWTNFRLVATTTFNPSLAPKALLLRFLCSNTARNTLVVAQLIMAVQAGRKVLVLSERLNHLKRLEQLLEERWPAGEPPPTVGWYVGGRTEDELEEAAKARVILATSQLVSEGLDIPALDTLLLTTPLSDVEQAVGRILRPSEGKKEPVVVDFRDDNVGAFKRMATYRDNFYAKVS